MIRLFAACVLAVLAACATTSTSTTDATAAAVAPEPTPAAEPTPPLPPVRIARPAYAVSVPAGWEELNNPDLAAKIGEGGLVVKLPRLLALPEFTTSTIIVSPIQKLALDPKDPSACSEAAKAWGELLQGAVETAQVIELPVSGQTCQAQFAASARKHAHSKLTIVHSPTSSWMVTCNFDDRDAEAIAACNELLQKFEFSAATAAAPVE